MISSNNSKPEAFSVQNQAKQLYLRKDTTYKHQTCTVVLLSTCTFQRYPNPSVWRVFWRPYTEKRRNPLSDYREGDTALHSTASLRAQSSYDGENLACSSMVVGLPKNEKKITESCFREETRNGVRQYILLSDHSCVRILTLEGYSSRIKQRRKTKLSTRSAKGLYYRSKAPPTSGNLRVRR